MSETAKARMLAILDDQPASSPYDDLLRKLALHRMVEHGLKDYDQGRATTLTTDELRRRAKAWQS